MKLIHEKGSPVGFTESLSVTSIENDGSLRGTYYMGDAKGLGAAFEFTVHLAIRAKGNVLSAEMISIRRNPD